MLQNAEIGIKHRFFFLIHFLLFFLLCINDVLLICFYCQVKVLKTHKVYKPYKYITTIICQEWVNHKLSLGIPNTNLRDNF